MKKSVQYLVLVLTTLFLSSCYSLDNASPTFFEVIGISENKFNSELTLEIIDKFTILKIGETVDLDAVNNINTPIQLVADIGIRVFKLNSDSEWVEIKNQLSYGGRIINIPTKENDPGGWGSFMVSVRPEINPIAESADIRIIVLGTILSEDGQENLESVGAYLDITLEP